ncbi:MAG: hypothetical protein ABI297_04355 [Ginsengibacter sp.]
MPTILLFALTALLFAETSSAQVDLNNLDLKDLIGKVMHVQKGFAPQFTLGRTPVDKISKVAEILGLKQNEDINRLFKTFKTGRTIYKVAAYTGGAIAVYSLVRRTEKTVRSQDYNAALYSGISAIGSGLIVKFLTKGASYKAVDIFNGIAVRKIKDIFSIAPASSTAGIGLYVKL